MNSPRTVRHRVSLIVLALTILTIALSQARAVDRATAQPLTAPDFVKFASQGFYSDLAEGRHNNYAWSMAWWKGKLYVGTGRDTQCVQMATLHLFYPQYVSYPPYDPTVACTPAPQDLPLQAEIWRWTPGTNTWDRVYQSPNDVPIPGHPGKFVARDIGFRGMLVFTEADGTEALYVSGVSSRSYNSQVPPFNPNWPPDAPQDVPPDMPPPRILRSTDGVNFEPIPLDPQAFTKSIGFRSLAGYKGRLYAISSDGYLGQGPVYEATDPARGNFRKISPEGMTFYELATYNDLLYLGGGNRGAPFALWKTNASGAVPYNLIPVITNGAFDPNHPGYPTVASQSIVSMHIFKNRLYVGTDRPAEILRINPDDTWDLVVGTPRNTPVGWKEPLSGMDAGFDWRLNFHIWRMETYKGVLYVSTFDQSTHWDPIPVLSRLLREKMGFDLYSSEDGVDFTMITQTGFGDKYDVGVRTFASTPCGLLVGGVNVSYGANLWRAGQSSCQWNLRLPIIGGQGSNGTSQVAAEPGANGKPKTGPLQPPSLVLGEIKNERAILTWTRPPRANRFRIFRSTFTLDQNFANAATQLVPINDQLVAVPNKLIEADDTLRISELEEEQWLPSTFVEVGTTEQTVFTDRNVSSDKFYHYYVLAVDKAGKVSDRSTLVRLPNLATPITFTRLTKVLTEWSVGSSTSGADVFKALSGTVRSASKRVETGDLEGALRDIDQLREMVKNRPELFRNGHAEDLDKLLAKLQNRMELVRLKILTPADLLSGAK